MKKILSLLGLFASLISASAFPIYDPFADATASGGTAYTAGADLWKQTNAVGDIWFGANTANAGGHVVLTNVTMSYSGLPPSPGNCVRFRNVNGGPGGRMFVSSDSSRFFFVTNDTTLYYSLLLQVPDVSTLSTGGDYDIGFNNQGAVGDQTGQPGIQAARLYLRKNGASYQVGIAKNTAVVAYDSTLHDTNETLFIVAGYQIVAAGTTDDNVRLWVNPAANTFGTQIPPTETTNILGSETDVAGSISSFVLLNRSANQPNGFLVDDVRIGKTWAFITGGPEIGIPPADTNVAYGSSFSLTVSAKSGGPSALTYQWGRNGTNLVNAGNISGVTTTNLTISAAGGADAGTYSIVVSNTMGSATNFAIVTVLDPVVTGQPTNQVVAPGSAAHFSIVAVGTPTLTYSWQREGTNLVNGGNISGASTASLTVSSASDADVATYSCLVTNGPGSGTVSSNATLTLVDPGFVSQPQSVTTNYGTTVVFSSVGVGTSPLSYRWQKDGTDLVNGPSASGATISGTASSNLTIAGVAYLDAGTYSVNITNGLGSSLGSDPALLTVNDPYISTQPVGQTNTPGTTANFTVAASGTPPLSYAWYKDNNPLSDGGNISGSTTNHLVVSSVGVPDIGNYYVLVTGGSGSNVTSVTVPLNVTFGLGQPLYWDSNGNSPGAGDPPTGTWGTDSFWSTDANGGVATGGWSDGSKVVFSAGTDSVSAVTVTVTSTRAVTGVSFEEGTVTLNGGTISMVGANGQSTISVADGLLATFNTTVIAGTNDLVKTGNGALRSNPNNTFTGRTIIRGGAEIVQGDSRFGAVPLSFQADNIILDGGTLECIATGNPGQQNNGQRGLLITTNNGTIAETAANGTGALTFLGVISGPGKLTKTGGAVLRLENVNTYAGGTDLNDGKIYVNANNGLGTGVVTINTTPGMILRTTLATATTITISNSIVLVAGANPLFSAGGNGTAAHFRLAGVISGDGGFTRGVTGDKDLIISGANTYAGGTVVDVGRLLVNNSSGSGTGSGTVTVNTAGILGGTGTISGAVTVQGGTLSAGSSAGKLTLQNGLDMSASGTNTWELAAPKDDSNGTAGTDFDQVSVTSGTINVSGGTLLISFTGTATAPDPTNSFWQSSHTWTVIALSGSASNPGPSNFGVIQEATNSAGVFTTEVAGNGSILLKFTPDATVPTIQNISGNPASATITWNAANGVNYQVQYRTNLIQTNWLVLTNVTGAGSVTSVTDNHGTDPMRFYRLSIVP